MSVNVALGGSAQFVVAGVLYTLAGTMKVKIGGWSRTPASGPSGATGNWTEKWVDPEIEVECYDDPAMSVTALVATSGVTVQLQLRNGKSYNLYNAYAANDGDIDAVGGKFPLKMHGTRCLEVTA
jgi:hypothetical protein